MTDIGMILVTVLTFLLMYFFVNWVDKINKR